MKSKTFIKAAQSIDRREDIFSCCAIDRVVYGFFSEERELYKSIFCPDMDDLRWALEIEEEDNCRQLRVMMLCLMAVCFKDFIEDQSDETKN